MANSPEVRARPAPARRWLVRALVALLATAAVLFGAVLIYANFINDPQDALTEVDLQAALVESTSPEDAPVDAMPDELEDPDAEAAEATGDDPGDDPGVEGRWVATSESEVGYRVTEVLFGVNTEGVGRTSEVDGELIIEDTTITAVDFSVDLASVISDDSRRDGQFRGRIMNVDEFPTAQFSLTEPIELGELPAPGEQITATAVGELTLRGTTNEVVFDVTAQRSDGRIGVLGNIAVVFADYAIPNPSIAGITTEDNGLLEFVLVFARP